MPDAEDASGRLIGKWSWMIATPSQLRAIIAPVTSASAAQALDDTSHVTVSAAGTNFLFSKTDGTLTSVERGGQTFPLRNGPTLSVGTANLTSFAGAQSDNDYLITAQYAGNLQQVEWQVLGNGWLRLSYQYSLNGNYAYSLRLFTPTNGSSPQSAAMNFPAHDISFLHGIAPIGDKFLSAANLGPQGQQHVLSGSYQATLYFRFGQRD